MLLLGFILSCVMLAPGVRGKLAKIPQLCHQTNCDKLVGYLAVYRVCFAMAAFFFLMTIITFKVKSSRDPRANFQNGYVYSIYFNNSILDCCSNWFLFLCVSGWNKIHAKYNNDNVIHLDFGLSSCWCSLACWSVLSSFQKESSHKVRDKRICLRCCCLLFLCLRFKIVFSPPEVYTAHLHIHSAQTTSV